MKVYIDEKDIGTTITYKEENGKKEYIYCHDREGFVFKDISDYTKQVRKEVCEEIRDIVKKLEKPTNNTDEKILSGEMIKVTQEQLIFLKKFIIKYDEITVEEYLEHNLWWEDFEKEDIVYWYKECPELMYIISPFLYYRLQKYYNEEALCAGWCGCVDLKQIYDYIKMRQKYNKEYFLE
jgi:hypothetical protein